MTRRWRGVSLREFFLRLLRERQVRKMVPVRDEGTEL